MKLSQLFEARYSKGTVPLYYFEYFAHHIPGFRYFETTLDVVDSFVRDAQHARSNDDIWDNVEERIGDAGAIGDIVDNWPEIRSALQTNGVWVGTWEEGSHAFSTKSIRHAKEAVKNFERENVINADSDYFQSSLEDFPDV